jgi:hypothetical protein
MKRITLITLALLIIAGASFAAATQDAELSLYNKIVAVFEKAESNWKLDRKSILRGQVITRWISGDDRALVSVALHASDDDARDHLKAKIAQWADVPEAKLSTTPLKDFGEEGFVVKTERVKGEHILFRKGASVAEVFGPTDEVARRFAQHLAEILPSSRSSERIAKNKDG